MKLVLMINNYFAPSHKSEELFNFVRGSRTAADFCTRNCSKNGLVVNTSELRFDMKKSLTCKLLLDLVERVALILLSIWVLSCCSGTHVVSWTVTMITAGDEGKVCPS